MGGTSRRGSTDSVAATLPAVQDFGWLWLLGQPGDRSRSPSERQSILQLLFSRRPCGCEVHGLSEELGFGEYGRLAVRDRIAVLLILIALVLAGTVPWAEAAGDAPTGQATVSCPIDRGPVTTNILLRVFPVRIGAKSGTAFTVEMEFLGARWQPQPRGPRLPCYG